MSKKMKILTPILALAVAAVAFGGCTITAGPSTTSWDEVLEFTITSDAAIGDTDNYGTYHFSLYMDEGQDLNLKFSADGAPVLLSLYTPEEIRMGYNPSTDNASNEANSVTGSLQEKKTHAATEGYFIYEAPVSGDYLATVKSSSPQAEIDVIIEYEIK